MDTLRTFLIDVNEFSWICGPEDLCLHGHVTVQISKTTMEHDGTVNATALYLLKTLTKDKDMSEHDIQMVPCCGHFLIANRDLSQVTISECDNGLDWSIVHSKSCRPKKFPEDAFTRNGYVAFWNEWRWRYAKAIQQEESL